MKIKYNGETGVSLTNGKIYDVISIEMGDFRIVDDTGEDYLFSSEDFEITDDSDYNELKRRDESREWENSESSDALCRLAIQAREKQLSKV